MNMESEIYSFEGKIMPVTKSASFSETLRSEVPLWIEQGLVDGNAAEKLLNLYPLIESKSKLVGLITIFGSVLIGLGVLLFVGSNWQHLSAFFKLGLIIAAVAAANFGGWHFSYKENARPKLGASLFLLGGLLYGAGIWLVAQTFQLDLDWSLGMGLWSIGLIPMAMLVRSVPLAILNGLVLLCWSFSGQHLTITTLTVLGIAICLSYVFRSRIALVLALIQGETFCVHLDPFFYNGNSIDPVIATLLWTGVLFTWYLWHREHKPLFSAPYLYVSLLIALPTFLAVTFMNTSCSVTWQNSPLTTQIILAIASGLYVASSAKKYVPEIIGSYLAIWSIVAIMLNAVHDSPARFMANVVMFASLAGLIYSGARRLDSAAVVNISTVFFAITVFCRYFDTFYRMMDRSLFFLLGGTVLLVGGYLLEQQRRTLIRGINQ
jgi:uncharacterized membrane protein